MTNRAGAQENASQQLDWLYDQRTKCWSVMTTMSIEDYLRFVEAAHEARGSLSGQRGVLTTTTAKRIRARMVEDLKKGAILPPVVIGAVLQSELFSKLDEKESQSVEDLLPGDATISIIDGMQRTAALIEASRESDSVTKQSVRVEFWLTDNVRAMIYRMLILNTGQVPWTISRQLSVVFAPLLEEIQKEVKGLEKMSSPDNPGRRVGAAQLSSDSLIELYIAFSLRKTAVDAKEAISDEFSRLDFVDNLADPEFQGQFYGALSMLLGMDKSFERYEGSESSPGGRYIFDRQPARIGFIVAIGIFVLGRPGADRPAKERVERLSSLEDAQGELVNRLAAYSQEELADFLKIDVLHEILDRRVGQVGRYERGVFSDAFKILIDERFDVRDLEQCWRAN
ncbi:MAG: hypothetical protein M3Y90_04105 [Actinomycetota bacterium]|nr:hypothetical protein [Actinomycetota bacterium]